MNKNAVYVAMFAVLCVLAGVLVGVGIVKRASLPWPGPEKPNFAERTERFMGQGPREPRERRGGEGPFEMLITKLDLNGEQKTKVEEILEKTRQEIDEVGKNIRSAITEIKEKSNKQIMDILNSPQQEKFMALLKELEKGYGPNGPGGERGPMRKHGLRPDEEAPPQR